MKPDSSLNRYDQEANDEAKNAAALNTPACSCQCGGRISLKDLCAFKRHFHGLSVEEKGALLRHTREEAQCRMSPWQDPLELIGLSSLREATLPAAAYHASEFLWYLFGWEVRHAVQQWVCF